MAVKEELRTTFIFVTYIYSVMMKSGRTRDDAGNESCGPFTPREEGYILHMGWFGEEVAPITSVSHGSKVG